jgi:hypothetical protein
VDFRLVYSSWGIVKGNWVSGLLFKLNIQTEREYCNSGLSRLFKKANVNR